MVTRKKAAAKKTAPVKKKTAATKAATKKTPTRKAPAKKVPAKKASARKAATRRPAARSGGSGYGPIPGDDFKLVSEFVVDQNGVLFFKFSTDTGPVLMSVADVIAGGWTVALLLEKLAAGQALSPETTQMLTAFANYLLSGDDAAPTVYVSCCP